MTHRKIFQEKLSMVNVKVFHEENFYYPDCTGSKYVNRPFHYFFLTSASAITILFFAPPGGLDCVGSSRTTAHLRTIIFPRMYLSSREASRKRQCTLLKGSDQIGSPETGGSAPPLIVHRVTVFRNQVRYPFLWWYWSVIRTSKIWVHTCGWTEFRPQKMREME